MGIGNDSRQCCRKWRPMRDLRRQKSWHRKVFYASGLYFHNLIIDDYFWKIN